MQKEEKSERPPNNRELPLLLPNDKLNFIRADWSGVMWPGVSEGEAVGRNFVPSHHK